MNEKHEWSSRIFNRYFILIWMVAFFLQIGQNIFNNSISLYLTGVGMSTGFIGMLAVPYAVMAILARVVGGYLTDHRGRRLTMLLGCLVFCVFSRLFATPALAIPGFLLIFRGMHGFGYATANTAASTAAVDVTPPEKMSLGLGVYWTAQGLAQALGGVLVTALAMGDDYGRVFWAATLSFGLAALWSVLCGYEKRPESQIRMAKRNEVPKAKGLSNFFEKRSLPFAFFMLFMYSGASICSAYTLLFAEQRGYSHAGLFFTMCAIGMTLANLISGKLAERLGAAAVVACTFVLYGLSLFGMVHVGGLPIYFICGFLYGASMGVAPVVQDRAVRSLPVLRRGAGTSTLFLATDVGIGLGTALWGTVIELGGFNTAFNLAAIFLFVSALFGCLILRREK